MLASGPRACLPQRKHGAQVKPFLTIHAVSQTKSHRGVDLAKKPAKMRWKSFGLLEAFPAVQIQYS